MIAHGSDNANAQDETMSAAELPTRTIVAESLTREQAHHLAEFAAQLYPEWSTGDIYEALGRAVQRYPHLSAAATSREFLAYAAKPDNTRPSGFEFTRGLGDAG